MQPHKRELCLSYFMKLHQAASLSTTADMTKVVGAVAWCSYGKVDSHLFDYVRQVNYLIYFA